MEKRKILLPDFQNHPRNLPKDFVIVPAIAIPSIIIISIILLYIPTNFYLSSQFFNIVTSVCLIALIIIISVMINELNNNLIDIKTKILEIKKPAEKKEEQIAQSPHPAETKSFAPHEEEENKCPKCGKINKIEAKYCSKCGSEIQS